MVKWYGSRVLPFSALLSLVGCAGVDPQPDYKRAAKYIAEVTGEEHVYRPGIGDEIVRRKVEELLSDGLAADEAVRISLLNNPGLQAAFLSIGLSRADVVQSSLLSNPSLTALIRFPTGGGVSNVEADLVQNLIELWATASRRLCRSLFRCGLEQSQELLACLCRCL